MSVDYGDLLYEKVQKEFDDYKARLMQMPQEEVFNHSYETATKEDLVCVFENQQFTQAEAKALYKLSYPLDACYQEWLNNDMSNIENLRDTVDERARSAVKEQKKSERESR